MIPAMWTPLHYPFIGGAPRLQNELEGSHSILNLQVYFNFDGGAKINEGGSPERRTPTSSSGGLNLVSAQCPTSYGRT